VYAVWHVVTDGLSRGSVWVNGHNLGRYPQTTKAPGVYIPECWLRKGDNDIIVLDEEGNSPVGVRIEADHDASRVLKQLEGRVGTR
jgi:beta-galactosidase